MSQKGKTMRPIDADALMEQPVWLCGGWVGDSYAEGYMDALDKVEKTVKLAPTIDAVPVVRCKDCASFRYSGMGGDNGITYCASMGIEMQPTDFCSYGERKDDE